MAILFLDDEIFQDSEQWGKDKETFNAAVNKWIDSHYKGEDSETVYAMFNPQQVELLQNFFKGFSVEMYKELNGTVELQIQKRNEKVKEKIKRIEEGLDRKIDLSDWVYDGMIDAGKNAGQKCDLCPRPIRYGHFAVSKKTGECLRFGCNCAADFFNMDKSSLTSMKTIQFKTLRDIKIIACVTELNKYEDYYTYMCGYTGKVILEEGQAGLRDLTTFLIKWDKDGKISLDENGDSFVTFGDGTKVKKSLQWVKDHIVSCLNADLDDDFYSPIEKRLIERKVLKEEDKKQMNTAGYVKYAMKFLDLGLPVPLSLCQKLNSIVRKINRNHHPDYLKYVQELLISHNLANSALLKKVFTDFMVNYLASSVGAEMRDPELEYWGVRGLGTFHKTVLNWETAMVKLMYLREFYSLVSQGYVSENEFDRFLVSRGYRDTYYTSEKIKKHVKRCMTLFLTKKEVIKNPDISVVTKEGYSKYTLTGVDDKISLAYRNRDGSPMKEMGENSEEKLVKAKKSFNSGQFTPDTILSDIGLHYYAMQQSYKEIINASLDATMMFLRGLMLTSGSKETIRYLCALIREGEAGSSHASMSWGKYGWRLTSAEKLKEKLALVEIDEAFYKEMYQKYKDMVPAFRKDAKELFDILSVLQENLNKPIIALPAGKKLTASNINSDYEDLVVKQEKTNKDYFKEYCGLLISKRGNKKIQQALYSKNLYSLTVYTLLEPYSDMLKEIQTKFVDNYQNEEEKKLYSYLNLGILKDTLHRYLDTRKLDDFTKFIAYNMYVENPTNFVIRTGDDYDNKRKMDRVLIDARAVEKPLSEKMVMDKIDEYLPKIILDDCMANKDLFKSLYDKYKELFLVLKGSKDFIKFEDYYNLLNEKSSDVEDYLKSKNLVSCVAFESKLNEIYVYSDKYRTKVKFENDVSVGFKNLLDKTKVYAGIADILKEIDNIVTEGAKKHREEMNRIERERRIKGPYLDSLKVHLKEHIAFFEVDVAALKKSHPATYGKSSDVTIRQKAAFHNVKFQNSVEENTRFIEELNILGSDKWSDGVADVIQMYKEIDASEYGKQKVCSESLRAEMYNHKLIYNHFDITYKLLKDLEKMDLVRLSVEEIQKLGEIMKYYYILKSQADYIVEVLNKYNALTFDYNSEFAKIPEPTYKNIQDIVDSLIDKADSTGFTGLEKANQVRGHADFAKLPNYLQNIVSSVCRYKRCTDKQLVHVNTAFAQLGLGTPDEVKSATVETENVIDEKAYTELAKQIIAHPDVKNAPDLSVKIATTVAKTGRCSEKQAKHLEKAKKVLGL